jgi:hypothetical protein
VGTPQNVRIEGSPVSPAYASAEHHLVWSDTPPEGQIVTISYRVVVSTLTSEALVNVVSVSGVDGNSSTASNTVLANPYPLLLPLVIKR